MDIASLLLIALLIALTAFFVATEFAIVKIRSSRIDQLVEEGKAGAKAAKHVITHMDEYLSACQLGITVTALGIGWLGEPAVKSLLDPIFDKLQINPSVSTIISVAVSFLFITYLHVVVGELAPKTVAIQRAENVTLLAAKPIVWFYRLMFPFIWLLNGSARLIIKAFGMQPVTEHETSHSEEELRIILSDSYKSGEINHSELLYVNNIFKFDDRSAKEIMVPRTEMVSLSTDNSFQDWMNIIKTEKLTRYPIYDGDKDNIIGIINVKDILMAQINHTKTLSEMELTSFLKPVILIIETISIQELFLKMQQERIHMAVLMDEYGGTSGLVTIEDIIEEIVGEIRDEFDTDEQEEITKVSEDQYLFSGKVLVNEVNDILGITLSDEEVDTLGGWILSQNSDVKIGDTFSHDQYSFTVNEMDGHQVRYVSAQKEEALLQMVENE
ncbi:CBS domain containing-hemolysin-like protein [Lederbergia galactosidilyticus]|uniref:hemolysin family protein n=1 Tax=Lederbergia galactosidilytica TaxID=217031 RepID=UPI001AE1F52A|nr:hemolysin family protein [Lederbergia galactosidilytica]MBP1913832.1 CBS domain containing-hemolysin-like protein [Lederbergia galactosidilytica]